MLSKPLACIGVALLFAIPIVLGVSTWLAYTLGIVAGGLIDAILNIDWW